MQVMFVLGLEFALSKSDVPSPIQTKQLSRGSRGLAFRDFHWVCCSAQPLLECYRWDAGRCGSQTSRVQMRSFGRLGCEQFEDQDLPTKVRDLCWKVPRKRHGVSLLCICGNHAILQPPHTNDRGLRKPWRHCRASRGLLTINMTTSASRRRGCLWARASRTPWLTTSGWSHRR